MSDSANAYIDAIEKSMQEPCRCLCLVHGAGAKCRCFCIIHDGGTPANVACPSGLKHTAAECNPSCKAVAIEVVPAYDCGGCGEGNCESCKVVVPAYDCGGCGEGNCESCKVAERGP